MTIIDLLGHPQIPILQVSHYRCTILSMRGLCWEPHIERYDLNISYKWEGNKCNKELKKEINSVFVLKVRNIICDLSKKKMFDCIQAKSILTLNLDLTKTDKKVTFVLRWKIYTKCVFAATVRYTFAIGATWACFCTYVSHY